MITAKRDMTRAQFDKILRERDWEKVLLWIDIGGGHSIGLTMINGKVNYRASIAYAIKRSNEIEAAKKKAPA